MSFSINCFGNKNSNILQNPGQNNYLTSIINSSTIINIIRGTSNLMVGGSGKIKNLTIQYNKQPDSQSV